MVGQKYFREGGQMSVGGGRQTYTKKTPARGLSPPFPPPPPPLLVAGLDFTC